MKPSVLFLIFYSGFLVAGAYILAFVPKGEEVYLLSALHTDYGDFFFKYFTHLGDGIAAIFFSLIFFAFRFYNGLLILSSYAVSGAVASVMKHFIFSDILRPINVLDVSRLKFVEGVEVHGAMSFPSGHTTSAFALFFALSLIFENKYWTVFFFLCAVLVAVSRMYLCQHFFIDTYTGSFIGIISCLICAYILEKFPSLREKRLVSFSEN
jgi:membrane-associated phospholipid phosphatase